MRGGQRAWGMALIPALVLTALAWAGWDKGATGFWAEVDTSTTLAGRWGSSDEAAAVPDWRTSPLAASALQIANEPYNAEFTFLRLRFDPMLRRGFGGGGREPPWAHDYPRAERNFARILSETTLLRPYMNGSNILATDDPDLFDYPIAYLSEPGYWTMTEAEVEGLRQYLLRGGFLIADDFRGNDWFTFEDQLRRVLPEHRLVRLPDDDRIFDSFFRIESMNIVAPTFQQYTPEFWGVYENNDPNRRLLVVANYNNDIGDYWEWSDEGWLPIPLSNEAYKLGVNYVIYALTH